MPTHRHHKRGGHIHHHNRGLRHGRIHHRGIGHGGLHHGRTHHGGIHHGGGICHGGIHHGGIHLGGIHGIHHGGIHRGIHHGGIHGGICHGGIHHGGIHHRAVNNGIRHRTTYSGQNFSTGDTDWRKCCNIFLRIPAILTALATFVTVCIALANTNNLSDTAKKILESDADEIALLYPSYYDFDEDNSPPYTPQLKKSTQAIAIFIIVFSVFAVVPQVSVILLRRIVYGKHRITLFIVDAIIVAVCVPLYFVTCGLASNLAVQWSAWFSSIQFDDNYYEVSLISTSLLANGITSGLAGVFHLVTFIAILVHVQYKRKDFPNYFCCFSKNTEEEAVASSASVDQNSSSPTQADGVSVPVPAVSTPQQVDRIQSEREASGLNMATSVPAVEIVGPTQSEDSSPAGKLASVETELREAPPPSYYELYEVQVATGTI